MVERRRRTAPKGHAAAYLAKADQFVRTMDKALASQDWDAVGLTAVHAVISAADAVTSYRGGFRNAEQDHRVLADVLEDLLGPESRKPLRHLKTVLAKKNAIQYEHRRLTAKEAADIAEHARRFTEWSRGKLPAGS
jgi:hypothetical protein